MYGWIWRRLPFGLPGKLIGSTLLIVAMMAVLWFWAFPAAEPLLPFDDVNVTDGGGGPAGVDPGNEPGGGPDEIPYSTESNQPSPHSS